MLDIIFIAATALFFAIGIFYVRGCETIEVGGGSMTAGDAALLVICVFLFGYLLYALLKAEEF